MVYTDTYKSPLGDILLAADEIGLIGLWFEGQTYFPGNICPGRGETMAGYLFFRERTGLYTAASSHRFHIPAGGMADIITDSLWADHDLR